MKFDWSNFTKTNYENYIEKCFDLDDYIGAVHIGDISIDLVNHSDSKILVYDFYVAHEDTGYGYKNDVLPYDYADGDAMDIPHDLSYEEFKTRAEKLFVKYIEAYKGNYSLVKHANKPLEMW